jgi:DNA-directed RNA polymerase subunit M/transcription elongation factor TFIIS
MPIEDIKQPEITVNPLITGLNVDQEPETLPIMDAIAVSFEQSEVPNASQNENIPTCPNCGSSKVRGNGNRKGKKTGEIIARRFECSNCSKQFSIRI